jgi:hypothetical protein
MRSRRAENYGWQKRSGHAFMEVIERVVEVTRKFYVKKGKKNKATG